MLQTVYKAVQIVESKKYAYLCLGIITIVFAIGISSQLATPEPWSDYQLMKPGIDTCSLNKMPTDLRLYLLCVSKTAFGEPRILPLIYTVLLLPVAYLFATKITNRPIAGLGAAMILATSNNYTIFAVSAAYDELWALMFIASLYFVLRKPVLSIPLFVVSILCKPLPLVWIPMILILIKKSHHSKKTKLGLASGFIALGIMAFIAWIILGTAVAPSFMINTKALIVGFYSWIPFMLYDFAIMPFIPFVTLLLFHLRKVPYSLVLFGFMVGMFLTIPLLQGIVQMTNTPYRFAPYYVIYGTGVGLILTTWFDMLVKKKLTKEVS